MLSVLRQQLDNKIIQGLLILLVLSFSLWGVGGILRHRDESVIVKVGDIEYTTQQWANALEAQVRVLQQHYGQQAVPASIKQEPQFLNHVLQQLINRALLKQESKTARILVSDDMTKMEIAHMPNFQNKEGKFDADIFAQILKNNNYTEKQFVELLKDDLAVDNLLSGLTMNKPVHPQLVSLLWQYAQADRSMDVYKINRATLKTTAMPTEQELEQTLASHIEQFTLPEKRSGRYFIFGMANVKVDENVPEQELQNLYNNRQFLFVQPEMRNISQIIIHDEAQAKKAAQELANKAAFDTVAKKYGQKVDLGFINPDELPAIVNRDVNLLKLGEYSAPIKSPLGWHIFLVKEIKPQHTLSFAEAHDQVKKIYLNEAKSLKVTSLAQELEQELSSGADITTVAAKHNFTVHNISLSANDNSSENLAKSGIADFATFKKQFFQTAKGASSSAMPTKAHNAAGESYFITTVDEVNESVKQPLTKVKQQVTEIWQNQQEDKAVTALASALSAARASGKADAWAKFASENNGKFTLIPAVSLHKDMGSGTYTEEIVRNIMELPQGGISLPMVNKNGDHIVIQVKKITLPSAPLPAEQQLGMQKALMQMSDAIIAAQYLQTLQKRYPIDIDQHLLHNKR